MTLKRNIPNNFVSKWTDFFILICPSKNGFKIVLVKYFLKENIFKYYNIWIRRILSSIETDYIGFHEVERQKTFQLGLEKTKKLIEVLVFHTSVQQKVFPFSTKI